MLLMRLLLLLLLLLLSTMMSTVAIMALLLNAVVFAIDCGKITRVQRSSRPIVWLL
jgi:hypothetical protein